MIAPAACLAALLFTVSASAQTNSPPTEIQDNQILVRELLGIEIYAIKTEADARHVELPRRQGPAATDVSADEFAEMANRYDKVGFMSHLVASADGRMPLAVVGLAGALGLTQHDVALPWSELRVFRRESGKYFAVVLRTRTALNERPRYRAKRPG